MARDWTRFASLPVIVLPVLLVWLAWIALDRHIETVQVVSELTPEERAAVSAAVHASIDGGILTVDIERIAGALLGLSWPRAVSVRRVWPDHLEVAVTKSTLIARWNAGQYLSSTGAVVTSAEAVPDLPLLECAMAEPREAMEMFSLLREISAVESLHLTELRQNRIGEWQIRFADQMAVNLGADHVIERMHRFIRAWRDVAVTEGNSVAYVDTRYPNGVAIRFNEMLADGGMVKP